MRKTNTLVLGGSFNPIHKTGHMGILHYVYHSLNWEGARVDEAWLLPAAQNPFKPREGMASYEDRFAMCEIQAACYPWVSVSDFENRMEPPHYTYRVLKKMVEAYPERQFIWMMGSDNLAHFHEWEYWEEMLRMVPVVVMERDGYGDDVMNSVTMQKYADKVQPLDADWRTGGDIRLMQVQTFAGSSTEIRAAIQKGEPTQHLSVLVRRYIDEHALYR